MGVLIGVCAKRADEVDIGDLLQPEMSKFPVLPLQAGEVDAAEIPGIERLAQVAAVARNRKHRRAAHEARDPAQMLAVEPAEHQRRPQHDAGDAAFKRDLLLRLLGLGVVIDRGQLTTEELTCTR